jgi:glycosyltransferase involved in cell wall biosynthesis
MKVAFTSDVYWPRVNGVTVSTTIFLNELRKLGHDVRLWAPEYPTEGDEDYPARHDEGVTRLKSFGLFFTKEDRLPHLTQQSRFFKELDAFGPDLLHVQTEFLLMDMAKRYARSRGIPMIQTCHTYFEQYVSFYFPWAPAWLIKRLARWLTYRWFRHADAIIVPTEPMKKVLRSYGITSPIAVVPTGIPEDDFHGVDKGREKKQSLWYEKLPQLKGHPLLLYVGRMAQEKNVDFLLDVIERVRRDVPDALLVAAGNGPYLETFQANIAARGLSDAVLTPGYVDRASLKHLYTLADVFTFASVTETQGLVTIEAMMCGTPAVAIGKMGTTVVMGGDNGGYMVDEDVEAFSGAVLKLLRDPELYAAKSKEARAHAALWTAHAMAQRIEEFYAQVLNQPG